MGKVGENRQAVVSQRTSRSPDDSRRCRTPLVLSGGASGERPGCAPQVRRCLAFVFPDPANRRPLRL